MPDPKLKQAAEEIKVILRKYDIAANVLLSSQSHIEFLRHFDASWSCARTENENTLRIRSKREEYPSIEAQKQALEDTVGMLIAFAEQSQRDNEALMGVAKEIGKKCHIAHMSRRDDVN